MWRPPFHRCARGGGRAAVRKDPSRNLSAGKRDKRRDAHKVGGVRVRPEGEGGVCGVAFCKVGSEVPECAVYTKVSRNQEYAQF